MRIDFFDDTPLTKEKMVRSGRITCQNDVMYPGMGKHHGGRGIITASEELLIFPLIHFTSQYLIDIHAKLSVSERKPSALDQFLSGTLVSCFIHARLVEYPFFADSEIARAGGAQQKAHQFNLVSALSVQVLKYLVHDPLWKLPIRFTFADKLVSFVPQDGSLLVRFSHNSNSSMQFVFVKEGVSSLLFM